MQEAARTIDDIHEGDRASHRYTISNEVVEAFLAASCDTNRLHVDDAYAREMGYPGRVMHGTILSCFVSHFVGMHFPGGCVLLHAVHMDFKSPCHLDDQIVVEGEVARVSSAVGAVVLDLVLTNETRKRVAARARVRVGVL